HIVILAAALFGWRGARLEPAEIGNGGGKVHGRRGADRPERIMRHHVDIMRLAPAGDLHRLGEAADIADVDAIELVDAAFDVGQELPLAGKFLADRERHVDHGPERFVGFGRFVTDRLLEEIERAGRHFLAEARRLRHREPVVIINAEHDLVAEFLAGLGAPAGRLANAFARLVAIIAALAFGKEADCRPACLAQDLRLLDHLSSGRCRGRGEGRHEMSLLAAEQLKDRHIQCLALDVVAGDVERRNRRLEYAAAFEILAAVHFLPKRASLEGITPDEEFTVVLDGPRDRLFAPRQTAFAPAEDTLVGLDLDQHLVAMPDPDRIGTDGGDLHFACLSYMNFCRSVGRGRNPTTAPTGDGVDALSM